MKDLTIKEQIKTLEATIEILNTHYEFTNSDIRLKKKIGDSAETIKHLTRILKSTGIK